MNCDTFNPLFYLRKLYSPAEVAEAEAHLKACERCRRDLDKFRNETQRFTDIISPCQRAASVHDRLAKTDLEVARHLKEVNDELEALGFGAIDYEPLDVDLAVEASKARVESEWQRIKDSTDQTLQRLRFKSNKPKGKSRLPEALQEELSKLDFSAHRRHHKDALAEYEAELKELLDDYQQSLRDELGIDDE